MKRAFIACMLIVLGVVGAQAATKKPKKDAPPPEPTELTGQVSRIVDGDTLWLKTAADAEPVVIRIEGIDAPESCQAGGTDATQALTKLVLNRNVTVRIVARDEHARVVGKVFDGTVDVGDRMVRDGHAWSARFKYDRGPYMAEERMAIALKRGLHGEGGAVQPRDFRQSHGPCDGRAGAAPSGVATKAAALAVAPVDAPVVAALGSNYRCDGRTYCSQMTSCQEATWFSKNCPGAKMDGNNDGVPCEKQWCKR
jgi:endonuclease YncB( thermonuclease family)